MKAANAPIKHRVAPWWFWILLTLILIASAIFYVIFQGNGRSDQINTEKETIYFQNELIFGSNFDS